MFNRILGNQIKSGEVFAVIGKRVSNTVNVPLSDSRS